MEFLKNINVAVNYPKEDKDDFIHFVTHIDPQKPTFSTSAKTICTSKYLAELIKKYYQVATDSVCSYEVQKIHRIRNKKNYFSFSFFVSYYSCGSISILFEDEVGDKFLYTGPFISHESYFQTFQLSPIMRNLFPSPLKHLDITITSDTNLEIHKAFDALCYHAIQIVKKNRSETPKIHFHSEENCFHILSYIMKLLQGVCLVSKDVLKIMSLLGNTAYFKSEAYFKAKNITCQFQLMTSRKTESCGNMDCCIYLDISSSTPKFVETGKQYLLRFSTITNVHDGNMLKNCLISQNVTTSMSVPGNQHLTLLQKCKVKPNPQHQTVLDETKPSKKHEPHTIISRSLRSNKVISNGPPEIDVSSECGAKKSLEGFNSTQRESGCVTDEFTEMTDCSTSSSEKPGERLLTRSHSQGDVSQTSLTKELSISLQDTLPTDHFQFIINGYSIYLAKFYGFPVDESKSPCIKILNDMRKKNEN